MTTDKLESLRTRQDSELKKCLPRSCDSIMKQPHCCIFFISYHRVSQAITKFGIFLNALSLSKLCQVLPFDFGVFQLKLHSCYCR